MRVNLLFGFLGSGKTTLVRRILHERAGDEPMAVIVNEFGEVGVDGDIIQGRNVDVVEITSGCFCCTLRGSLLNALEELEKVADLQRVVVESTGVSQPEEMLETLADPSFQARTDMGPLVTVVDAHKFPLMRKALGEFYEDQVHFADVVILNKIDLVTTEQLDAVTDEIVDINPDALLLFSEQCDVDVGPLLDMSGSAVVAQVEPSLASRLSPHQHAGDHDHDQSDHPAHFHPDSFVLDAAGHAPRAALVDFFESFAPESLWRAKGFMEVDGEPSLIQFVAGQLEISRSETRPNPKLVFIGRDLDEQGIEARFNAIRGAAAQ